MRESHALQFVSNLKEVKHEIVARAHKRKMINDNAFIEVERSL